MNRKSPRNSPLPQQQRSLLPKLRRTHPWMLALLVSCAAVVALAGWRTAPPHDIADPGTDSVQRGNRFRILFTANTYGYIDPCQCSAGLLGGLDKRTAAIERARDVNRPIFLIDLGNLFEVPRLGPPTELGRRQAAFLSEEMVHMGYQLHGLGAKDLSFEPGFLAEYLPELENPPLLTNRAEGADLGITTIPKFRLEIAGLKLDFFCVVDPRLVPRKDILTPWEDALGSCLDASVNGEDPADLQVVIIHAEFHDAEAIPRRFPKIDLLLDGDMLLPRQAFRRENTVSMSAAGKGQQLAILDITSLPRDRQEESRWVVTGFQGRHIPLPPGAPSDSEVWHRMRAFKAKLAEEGLIPPLLAAAPPS